MKFTLTLVASQEDGAAAITTAEVTISPDAMQGMTPTNGHALDVILEALREKGFSID